MSTSDGGAAAPEETFFDVQISGSMEGTQNPWATDQEVPDDANRESTLKQDAELSSSSPEDEKSSRDGSGEVGSPVQSSSPNQSGELTIEFSDN